MSEKSNPEQAQLSTDRLYHEHNRKVPFADRIGYIARRTMFNRFMSLMQPSADARVLDIGVTDDIDSSAANMLEQLYPYRRNITCAGITEGATVEATYPGVKHVRIEPGAPLPFKDSEFDIVYSNAVLEHVGSSSRQREFVHEACRVGKNVFIAVPNRLFPVEVHTGLPLIHYLPKSAFRSMIRNTRYHSHSLEEHLNYVSARELRGMFPASKPVRSEFSGVGFGPFRSNILSFSRCS